MSKDAVARLVQALRPPAEIGSSAAEQQQEYDASLDLATQIVQSRLGNTDYVISNSNNNGAIEFAEVWKRRFENQCHVTPQQQFEMERLYEELANDSSDDKDPALAAKILEVLTKCAGRSRKTGQQHHHHQNPPSRSGYLQHNSHKNDARMEGDDYKNSLSHAVQYEEQQVLRELLYALQGIEGERIKFYSRDDNDTIEEGPQHYEGIRILSPALQGAGKMNASSTSASSITTSQLGSGALDALRICGEAGWLVRRLQHYVEMHLKPVPGTMGTGANSSSSGGGQVARALARSVAQELQAYHDCLAQWEEQYLGVWSLRQWLVQIQRHPVLQRLTVLAMITEALPSHLSESGAGVGGGTLLSALHSHSLHGDTRHKSLVQSVLYPTSQPWFHMLYLWTTQGLLPASWGGDFFVSLQASWNVSQRQANFHNHHHLRQGENRNAGNKHLWHDKYTMVKAQIPHPGIFSPELVRPAFVIGKGINFIRTCLNQVGWTLKLEDDATLAGSSGATVEEQKANDSDQVIMERLGYYYVADPMGMHLNSRLARTLLLAEQLVHSHILQSLRQDHYLLEHLFALKQFLFHGQGDFFSSLMEGLYSEFGCGTQSRHDVNTSFNTGVAVAGVYPHQLITIMETALRRTNAKDLPGFCLERLRVEMLPFEPDQAVSAHGLLMSSPRRTIYEGDENDSANEEDNRTVWDIFMLDYPVPDPLVAIVHEKAMEQYKLVYSFLFGLRKVEYMLHRTWRQSATLQHALQKMAQNNGLQRSSSAGYAHATVLLRRISMTRQAMTHFIVNLKSYCMLEVLEGGWKELQENLKGARTLDEAIQAHDYYLESICRKILLSKRSSGRSSTGSRRSSSNKFREVFGIVLKIATDFCMLQERLFDEALEAAERVSQRRREAEQRMTQGYVHELLDSPVRRTILLVSYSAFFLFSKFQRVGI